MVLTISCNVLYLYRYDICVDLYRRHALGLPSPSLGYDPLNHIC